MAGDRKTKSKGWSTKYALTKGILAVTVENGSEEKETKYVYTIGRFGIGLQLIRGRTFFETEKEARENAIEQAQRKLKAIERQKHNLELLIRSWDFD